MTSDESTYKGRPSMQLAGTGVAYSRSCLPCGGSNKSQAGGGVHRFMGARTWFCPTCNEKWHMRQARRVGP